jgi:vancomycin resistance protein VanJ
VRGLPPLPANVAQHGAAVPLTAMTFNTANDFVVPEDLILLLSHSGADVVALQELGERNAAALEHSLEETYPYRVLQGEYVSGKGLLSRQPILAWERFTLASGRPYVEARLSVGEQVVTVYVVHAPPGEIRRLEVVSSNSARDIQMLLERASLETPTLLLGDFNIVPGSRSYRLLRQAGLIDTFRYAGAGWGLTSPTRYQYLPIPLPRLVRIDYIWATAHFVPLAGAVGPHIGSDHLPVVCALALRLP